MRRRKIGHTHGRRWECKKCGASGWSTDGQLPVHGHYSRFGYMCDGQRYWKDKSWGEPNARITSGGEDA